MKVANAFGAQLDWMVAKAIGEYKPVPVPSYSTDWAIGGPILNAMMASGKVESYMYRGVYTIEYNNETGGWVANGPTPLVAAMRCYVASKLGDEVEPPKELA